MSDIESRSESQALNAAGIAWVDQLTGSDAAVYDASGSLVRRAIRAGWLAGREWARGYAAGVVMGRELPRDGLLDGVVQRAIALGEDTGATVYQRGMAAGCRAGRELTDGR